MNVLLVGGLGYVGSFLYQSLAKAGVNVVICDTNKRGNPFGVKYVESDYAELESSFLLQFTHILWFAGHSSV